MDAKDAKKSAFSRAQFESLLKRRFFFTESFEIYRTAPNFQGDNRGLYDYGPPGCALQANIVAEWRNHFVIEENIMELDCTAITPADVLKTSGHVEKFADYMCRDPAKGEYLRADHLVKGVLETRLENHAKASASEASAKKFTKLDDAVAKEYGSILAKLDNYDGPALGELIKQYDIRNPNGNGEVLPPVPFNLMFQSSIGPSAAAPVYLRPETAQGQFLNFQKLLEFRRGAMPFASACIGKSYRNEISPRSGLLRVREFLMAEIEHFVDPDTSKSHDRFEEVASVVRLPLLDRDTQLAGRTDVTLLSIGEAVHDRHLVDNETLGYFIARIYLFLIKIGADPARVRFRQHLANEMAHYACDCWDAELLTSYGWIECVGCADRSAYDLTVHAKHTGAPLCVEVSRPAPIEVEAWEAELDKKVLGPRFKKDAKKIEAAVGALDQQTLEKMADELAGQVAAITLKTEPLASGASSVELSRDICTIKKVKRVEHTRTYTPNVIEPSFGIGRILYSVLEHAYWHRAGDVARGVLSLPILVAPTKVLIAPLSNNATLQPLAKKLASRLRRLRIANDVDSSSTSIGKRYARNDELGTPLGVTIDFESVKDGSLTLRERDSMAQVRSSEDDIVQAICNLVEGRETWEEVQKRLPAFASQNQDA